MTTNQISRLARVALYTLVGTPILLVLIAVMLLVGLVAMLTSSDKAEDALDAVFGVMDRFFDRLLDRVDAL